MKLAVALDHLALLLLARRARREPPCDEATLGAHRHDDGVLDVLRLHQAQDLGAEVLRPFRPADAAARDGALAQVHAFELRTVDEDLVCRPWLRQPRNLAGIEFERQPWHAACRRHPGEVVGAQRGANDRQEGTQDAVLVRTHHGLDRAADGLLEQAARRRVPRVAPGASRCSNSRHSARAVRACEASTRSM